jgi:tRNA A37 threonylcarbamoyladenosine biosynthesis protein TsaE
LNRKQYAEAFARIEHTRESPLVVSLYGAWGAGKTSLMRLVEKELDQDRALSIRLNLWEHHLEKLIA